MDDAEKLEAIYDMARCLCLNKHAIIINIMDIVKGRNLTHDQHYDDPECPFHGGSNEG